MKKASAIILITVTPIVLIIIALLIYFLWKKYAENKMNDIMNKKQFIDPTPKFRITSPFGYRTAPLGGASTFHNGIDIATPTGTPVVSPADGTVTDVNQTASGGKQVIVTHYDGYKTGYSHLSEQLVTAGQKVAQGELIAKTGNTGNSTGAHLHFTLTYNGIKIDPQLYFYK
ncbi:MAG: M23 family metallopeptidase [Prevotellaceae bacterium]|jgi:murein DD-endopeptidase MepM/ murein hydrolase activator NlpD|nr:M23 family metallopeptidase [Prevotellaceae bacterium]